MWATSTGATVDADCADFCEFAVVLAMLSIGVITRGKYGLRLIENVRKNSNFKISSVEIPENLPDFIEEPADLIDELIPDKSILSNDLIITYTLHPDLTPQIIRLAGENGAKSVIIAGGASNAGGQAEITRLSKEHNINVQIHEICCEIVCTGEKTIDEFATRFGRPDLRVNTNIGVISKIEIIRGAPCGSTWHMAKELVGIKVEEAPAKAGLRIQQYPCRAVRGNRGGIHKAAKLHKESVEKALEKSG
ncbi:MAG: DUF166 domain-containing protein [Candidatus Methanoperedens sp.]|nr:DUF166 domain-containing protein [Candidatus Methanoperedens sp.]